MKQKEFTIKLDKKKCLRCGFCVTMAPDLFVFNTNRTISVKSVKRDKNTAADKKNIQKIAKHCVGGALKIN